MNTQKRVLVTGAGGFIGHHLTSYLVNHGYWVRGVDIKRPEYEDSAAHEFEVLDLRRFDNCLIATRGISEVYGLAADMGGIGFIETNKGDIVRNNTLINLHPSKLLASTVSNDIFTRPVPAFTPVIAKRVRISRL